MQKVNTKQRNKEWSNAIGYSNNNNTIQTGTTEIAGSGTNNIQSLFYSILYKKSNNMPTHRRRKMLRWEDGKDPMILKKEKVKPTNWWNTLLDKLKTKQWPYTKQQ